MRELFLFVRPPRPVLPFDEPTAPFWPPLAFASLAASLRENVPEFDVGILDASALQMGWKSLETELRRRRPRWIGVGEEAVACVEVFRLARLARDLNATVIGGGTFFGNLAPQALATGLIDVIVHGEGEVTLVDLAKAMLEGSADALLDVPGISFRQGTELFNTPDRPLIDSLDALPFPAYDLLPMERYGARSRHYPHLAAIELGRGCIRNCPYCVAWRQMCRRVGDQPHPHLRVKSPERLADEIQVLMQRHNRRHLSWVDPCFNADPTVPGQLAERLLKAQLSVSQSAWLDAEGVARDAASGALAASVRSGLHEVFLHVRRSSSTDNGPNGTWAGLESAREALEILRRDHPEVYVFGTFAYGFPEDTPDTIRALHDASIELGFDTALFIPATPFPGTPGWKPDLWDITGEAFRQFHLLPDSVGDEHRRELEDTLDRRVLLGWPAKRLRNYAQQLGCPHPRRRNQRWLWLVRSGRFHLGNLFRKAALGPIESPLVHFPPWYES